MMKSLLLQAQSQKMTNKSGKQLKKAAATSRYRSFSTYDGQTSDEYTSGAINSDDDPRSVVYCRDAEPTTSTARTPEPETPGNPACPDTENPRPSSANGHSSNDHRPLSSCQFYPARGNV